MHLSRASLQLFPGEAHAGALPQHPIAEDRSAGQGPVAADAQHSHHRNQERNSLVYETNSSHVYMAETVHQPNNTPSVIMIRLHAVEQPHQLAHHPQI